MSHRFIGFDGVLASHVPSHHIVPLAVSPHEFLSLIHVSEYHIGRIGTTALQVPLHCIVHVVVAPHKFCDEVQLSQKLVTGFGQVQSTRSDGTRALHNQSHHTVHVFILPQLLGAL